MKSKFVSQIWVYGDSTKANLVAVVFPDIDAIIPWAASHGIPVRLDQGRLPRPPLTSPFFSPHLQLTGDKQKDFVVVCNDQRAAEAVAQDLRQVAKSAKVLFVIPSTVIIAFTFTFITC